MEETKTIWMSKTFWFNTVAVLAMMLQQYTGFVFSPEQQLQIVAGINVVLRLITKQPVTFK